MGQVNSLTVVFKKPIDEEHAAKMALALQCLDNNILNITYSEMSGKDYLMREQIKFELRQQLLDVLAPKNY